MIPTWIAFELIPTKLVHYTLPTYPALALICGVVLVSLLEGKRFAGWAAHFGAGGFALVTPLFAALIAWAPIEYGAGLAGIALIWLHKADVLRAVTAVAASGVVMLWSLFAGTLPALFELWITPRLAAAVEAQTCLSGEVAIVGFHAPSTVFSFCRDTRLMGAEEAMLWLSEAEGRAAWIPLADVPDVAPGVAEVTQVSGTKDANGNPVVLRLLVSPGIVAPETVC